MSVTAENHRPPFVLVHGAWHGGWCWRKVRQSLQAERREVFTPTLTGLGERRHLLSRDVDLNMHIQDIVNVLEFEDLDRVVLCGHSYAGMIITAVADRVPERIGALVYVDAYVPHDGQCVLDIRSPDKNRQLMQRVKAKGEGWLMPPTPAAEFGVQSATDRHFVDSKCMSMPLICFTQAVSLAGPTTESIEKHFILARQNSNAAFRLHHENFLNDSGWRTHEVDCGHEVMVDRPQWLSALLNGIR